MKTNWFKRLLCLWLTCALAAVLFAVVMPALPLGTAAAVGFGDDDDYEYEEVDVITTRSYTAFRDVPFYIVAGDKTITKFKINDKAQAKINTDTGLVTPRGHGSTKIKVYTSDGSSYSLQLTVVDLTLPTGIFLSEEGTVVLDMGETLEIEYELEPETAKSDVSWKSSKSLVAKVRHGIVTPRSVGTTVITATTERGQKSAKVTVVVIDTSLPTAIYLSEEGTVTIFKQDTLELDYELEPDTAVSDISWRSDNTKVAKVQDGVVIPRKAGKATITATTKRGKKTAKVTVLVIDGAEPVSVSIDQGSYLTLTKGETYPLTATVETVADFDYEGSLKWSTSSSKIVSVSKSTGVIKARKAGTSIITVKTNNGKTASILVTVI